MFHVPENHRMTTGVLRSSEKDGNNGVFIIPIALNVKAIVISSDGSGWEHVSVHIAGKYGIDFTPDWDQMCTIKRYFWDLEDCVVQFHPPESKYVNNHPNVLHLWRQVGKEFTLPDSKLVGIK